MLEENEVRGVETELKRARERERKAWERVQREQEAAVRAHEEVFAPELESARLRARAAATA